MNKKGFTLIELLIVLAIIGILAAVGAVVIPNVLNKTKVTAIEEQHKNIINFIKLEKAQCAINTHQKLVTASGGNYEPPCADFLNISQMPNNIHKITQHLIGIGYKNILEPSKTFFCNNGNFYPGCTYIDCSTCAQNKGSSIVTVETCIKGSCTKDDIITDIVNFE